MSKILRFSYIEGHIIKEDCPYYEELLKDDEDVKKIPKIGSASCSYCAYHKAINMQDKRVKCSADESIPKPIPLTHPIVSPINHNIFRKTVLKRIKQGESHD